MGFIANSKYKEIYEASKNGNEKALRILQSLRNKESQADLDRLVEEYYNIPTISQENTETPEMGEFEAENIENPVLNETVSETPDGGVVSDVAPFDLTQILDDELVDLLDENEVEDLSFNDFLKNKSKDALRSRKNGDYFKAYDPIQKGEYMTNRINNYKGKFDGRLKNIERNYNDINKSMMNYNQNVNDMLDDNVELDMAKVGDAYNGLTTDENVMGSFGRHWDEMDNNVVAEKLKELVAMYGKQNVLSALNTLNSDNENYKNFLNNQIDTEVVRYSKSLENLLK